MHHGWFLLGSSQRYWSNKQNNYSTLCDIYVFSFPLLAVTNHAPPVWHGSFASQQAAICKTHLLTLRLQEAAAVLLPAAWLGELDTCPGSTSCSDSKCSLSQLLAQIHPQHCAGMSRCQQQEITRGLWTSLHCCHAAARSSKSWWPKGRHS